MQNDELCIPGHKRKPSAPLDGQSENKTPRNEDENQMKSPDKTVGWQAAMGSSLADALEHLTVDRHLNARQVKKLLRAVLTNEDVVSAFRRYINLSDPETGELSAATRQCAKDLGLVQPISTGMYQSTHELEPRMITRSLARTIQQSLQDYLPRESSESSRTRCTILNMEFPDDEDNADGDEDTLHGDQVDADGTVRASSAPGVVARSCVDEDYVPGPMDMYMLRHDQALDLSTCATGSTDACSSPRTITLTDLGSSPAGERSNQSTDVDYSVSDDCTADWDGLYETRTSPYMTRFGSRRSQCASAHRPSLDSVDHTVARDDQNGDGDTVDNDDDGDDEVGPNSTTAADHGHVKLDEPSVTDEKESSEDSAEEVGDTEDGVYAEFLRSLFPSGSSSENTPRKKSHVSVGTTHTSDAAPHVRLVMPTAEAYDACSPGIETSGRVHEHAEYEEAPGELGGTAVVSAEDDDDEDPDDPEFDVMAELDQVNREDFLDELRDDRAVRVSKMEAKSLHRDLQKLFSDEEEEDGEGEDGGTTSAGKPNVSAMLAMKSHCHRLLSAKRKLEEPDPSNSRNHRTAGAGEESPANAGSEPAASSIESTRPKFPPNELLRLKRQLGMHIQLLATNFVCTYDFPHLHQSVTRPSASALKQLTSRRDAFDLLAQQHSATVQLSPDGSRQPVRSFYWCCASLDEAVHLISDYAGLSMLPQLSFYHRNLSWRNELSKSRVLSSLPLPYCLIRLMVHNPIWSYACLMPATLPPAEEFEDLLSRSRRRIGIYPNEDALLLLGLADFHDARLPGDAYPIDSSAMEEDSEDLELGFQPSQHIAYRLIRQHLLPFRTMLQLRARRWNLVAPRTGSKPLALPTQRLIQLFRNLSKRRTLKFSLLNELAADLAEYAVPYHVPFRAGCLADMDASDLFTEDGLPSQVGYEAVLLNEPVVSRVRKGAYSKLIHDVVTDFVQQAQCLWWSRLAPAVPPRKSPVPVNTSPPRSQSTPVSTCAATGMAESLVLKSEETEPHLARLDRNVLGPTFLPAIPVELGPDGRVVLSRKAEPAVVMVESEVGLSQPTASVALVTVSGQNQGVRGSEPSDSNLSINAHVQSLLQQIRSEVAKAVPLSKRRSTTVLHPQTLKELSSSPTVSGKLPLPPLNSRKLRDETSLSNPRSLASVIQPAVTAFAKLNVVTTASDPGVSRLITAAVNAKQSSPKVAVRSSPQTGSALANCQKTVDSLIDMFHCGLDKALSLHGEALFGPRKFDQVPKPSPLHEFSYESNKSGMQPGYSHQSGQIDCGPLTTPAITFFSNTSVLTANRFLSRCKARGEATSADLLILPSSIAAQRQPVLDEIDVRRARSFLDRCRVYLDAQTYGFVVLALRNLNQIVYQPTLQLLDLPTLSPGQRRRKVLNGLANVLDLLKGNRPLWEDFVCLLTPTQARAMGLLPTYWNLCRVGRVQRVMLDLIPRGKRFWRRLRNLADSCSPDEQLVPVKQDVKSVHMYATHGLDEFVPAVCQPDQASVTVASSSANKTSDGQLRSQQHQTRQSRIRSKGAQVRSPITKTWAFLESTWRNRPILLSQQACLLNVNHKPYSGFEQDFEEIDTLARNPLGQASFANQDQSVLNEGWEVCTDLSAAARRRSGGAGGGLSSIPSAPSRHCPCPCHPAPGPVNVATNPTGKPAKADSLGLRHCISCSLRVHRGIVYVDECNFHLRHVHITWPPDFRPKAQLLPSNASATQAQLSADHTCSSRPISSHATNTLPTRLLLSQLAETHATSGSDHECLLPDFARRRVSIEFVAPCAQTHPCSATVVPSSTADDHADVLRPEKKELQRLTEDDEVSVGSALVEAPSPVDMATSPGAGSDTGRLRSPSNWLMDDDDAACFNTEAFACPTATGSRPATPARSTPSPRSPVRSPTVPWDAEEDRQLLEFSKARGRYSSCMFHDLARCWNPKPDESGPRRTAAELEVRFKQLMRVMLGDAYDSDLFCSPDRESSEDEIAEPEDHQHYFSP